MTFWSSFVIHKKKNDIWAPNLRNSCEIFAAYVMNNVVNKINHEHF